MKFSKEKLIKIAIEEAEERNSSITDKNSGRRIEKYLYTFREALDKRANTNTFADTNNGYDWCGSFVYYCLNQAGMKIPVEPIANEPTFALVKTWYKWAVSQNRWFEDISRIGKGDLIIFKHESDNDRQFKHIGIIVGLDKSKFWIRSAEGNVKFKDREGNIRRRTQFVEYQHDKNIRGYIKL